MRAPLEAPYVGPYEIIERLSDRVYKLDVDGSEKTLSVDRLKPAYLSKTDTNQDDLQESTPQEEHKWGASMDPPQRT